MLRLAMLLFACVPLFSGECHVSQVEYLTPAVVTNPEGEITLQTKTAYGCVYASGNALVVIQTSQGPNPITVLVIPIGSVSKVQGLKDDDPATQSFNKLPTTPEVKESVNKSQPGDRRLM